MGYLYPHLPPHLPPCGVATTHLVATLRGAAADSNKKADESLLQASDRYSMRAMSYLAFNRHFLAKLPIPLPKTSFERPHMRRDPDFLVHICTLLSIHCAPVSAQKRSRIESTLILAFMYELLRLGNRKEARRILSSWAHGHQERHGHFPGVQCLVCEMRVDISTIFTCNTCFWVSVCCSCLPLNKARSLNCSRDHGLHLIVEDQGKDSLIPIDQLDSAIKEMADEIALEDKISPQQTAESCSTLTLVSQETRVESIPTRENVSVISQPPEALANTQRTDVPHHDTSHVRKSIGGNVKVERPRIGDTEVEALTQEIATYTLTLSECQELSWDFGVAQNNLAYCLRRRGQIKSNFTDLREALPLATSALNTLSKYRIRFPSVQGDIWTNLANTFSNLYEATHDVEYLNSALAFGHKALGVTYGDVPSRSFALSNFFQLLVDNCRPRKRRRDCFEALELATNAILLPQNSRKSFTNGLRAMTTSLRALAVTEKSQAR